MEVSEIEERIRGRARILRVARGELPARPAIPIALRIGPDYCDRDDISQSLEVPDEIRTMGKRAEESWMRVLVSDVPRMA